MSDSQPSFEAILHARFGALAPLDDSDRAFLSRIAGRARDNHAPGARLWTDTQESRPTSIVVSGWACVARDLKGGTRQIIEILLPGDIIGFGVQARPTPVGSVVAMTPLRTVVASELTSVWKNRHLTPRMGARLESLLAEQHFLLASHIVRLGRGSAYSRIANLLAELHWRLEQRGLAVDEAFVMPLTQEQIADTVGLSVVHVNRTLQQLRSEGFISQRKGLLSLSLAPIRTAGEFLQPRIDVV